MDAIKVRVVREVRTEAGVPVRNSVLRGFTGDHAVLNGIQMDADALKSWNEVRATLGRPPIEVVNPEMFLPLTPSP